MTGQLRGKTLDEKRYGPGYRPVPSLTKVMRFDGCAVMDCTTPVHATIELYVDDAPPITDWYTKLLGAIYAKHPNTYVRVGFCEPHMTEVVQRSVYDIAEDPDQWAPWRDSPPVLPRPPKLVDKPKLIVP